MTKFLSYLTMLLSIQNVFFFLIINKLEKKEKEKKIIMWYGAIIKFDIDTILFVLLYSYYLMWLELLIYVYGFQLVQLI